MIQSEFIHRVTCPKKNIDPAEKNWKNMHIWTMKHLEQYIFVSVPESSRTLL